MWGIRIRIIFLLIRIRITLKKINIITIKIVRRNWRWKIITTKLIRKNLKWWIDRSHQIKGGRIGKIRWIYNKIRRGNQSIKEELVKKK